MARPAGPGPRPLSRPEVREALEQATLGEEKPPAKARSGRRARVLIFGLLLAVLGMMAWLVETRHFLLPGSRFGVAQRVPLALFLVVLAVAIEQVVEGLVLKRLRNAVTRYNATRVLRFLTAVVVLSIVASILLNSLYTGLVSLGVISLILGLAVQAPMTSFVG